MNQRFFLVLTLLFSVTCAQAQYFGRNKPRYQNQEFKVTQTEHFEIYEYLNNPEKKKELADAAELWYQMHQAVLKDTFTQLNPLLIYNDHAGFQQTNAIQGDISVGTGGVTEGLRNRVVFPVAVTNQQTHHVMGHELVHAFQYHMVLEGDSTNIRNMGNLPLWMVEGLAEYLSIGRIDPHTSLWMRDAVLHDKLPKNTRALYDGYRYFPYRWGQSFWAYVAGRYGDDKIRTYFMNTAKYGIEAGTQITFGITSDNLIGNWTVTLKEYYGRQLKGITPNGTTVRKGEKDKLALDLSEKAPGKPIITDKNAGRMNVCPVISPNGKYIVFLSEKNLFTTDLFLADAKTGKIKRKLSSTARDGHIDQFNAIESAGTWSPDSKRYAFDAYQGGQSMLIIVDALKRGKSRKYRLKDVPSFSNPAWSPDGRTIVVTGQVNGQTDLYAFDVKTKKTRRLTNDRAAEILPSWSADGSKLTFSTDQVSLERGRMNGVYTMNLAVMDFATGQVDNIDVFPGANNLNPQFDKTGKILFLSDRDGYRNLYEYNPATQKTAQLTDLLTGITGITPYAPALSVAEDRDRIIYTLLSDGEYIIYEAQSSEFVRKEVENSAVDASSAALPPFDPRKRDLVNTNLRLMDNNTPSVSNTNSLKDVPYKTKFKLEYIGGGAGVGVATGNTSFGNNVGVGGGVSMLFGDILGNHQIFTGLGLNGQVQDVSGMVSYINNKKRIGWGINAMHFPFSSFGGYQYPTLTQVTIDNQQYELYEEIVAIDRLFNQRVGGLIFYPFSVTKRVELSASMDFYQQRTTYYKTYYNDPYGYYPVISQREKQPRGPRFRMGSVGTAYVGDNSFFGGTAPLSGWRYRFGAEQYFGFWHFTTGLADARYYLRLKPVTFAVRGLTYGRFGGNSNNTNEVFPFFLTQPWFIRGFLDQSIYQGNPDLFESTTGSKMGVFNAEIRLPFTGPKGLGLIPTKAFISDLNLFFDAGVAVYEWDQLKKQDPGSTVPQHKPIASTGISLRVNLFGALILEPYFAMPLTVPKDQRVLNFGFNFLPGW